MRRRGKLGICEMVLAYPPGQVNSPGDTQQGGDENWKASPDLGAYLMNHLGSHGRSRVRPAHPSKDSSTHQRILLMKKVKSCPFCGDSARVYTRMTIGVLGLVKRYAVGCDGCGISTQEVDEDDDEHVEDFLIDLWNKRHKK